MQSGAPTTLDGAPTTLDNLEKKLDKILEEATPISPSASSSNTTGLTISTDPIIISESKKERSPKDLPPLKTKITSNLEAPQPIPMTPITPETGVPMTPKTPAEDSFQVFFRTNTPFGINTPSVSSRASTPKQKIEFVKPKVCPDTIFLCYMSEDGVVPLSTNIQKLNTLTEIFNRNTGKFNTALVIAGPENAVGGFEYEKTINKYKKIDIAVPAKDTREPVTFYGVTSQMALFRPRDAAGFAEEYKQTLKYAEYFLYEIQEKRFLKINKEENTRVISIVSLDNTTSYKLETKATEDAKEPGTRKTLEGINFIALVTTPKEELKAELERLMNNQDTFIYDEKERAALPLPLNYKLILESLIEYNFDDTLFILNSSDNLSTYRHYNALLNRPNVYITPTKDMTPDGWQKAFFKHHYFQVQNIKRNEEDVEFISLSELVKQNEKKGVVKAKPEPQLGQEDRRLETSSATSSAASSRIGTPVTPSEPKKLGNKKPIKKPLSAEEKRNAFARLNSTPVQNDSPVLVLDGSLSNLGANSDGSSSNMLGFGRSDSNTGGPASVPSTPTKEIERKSVTPGSHSSDAKRDSVTPGSHSSSIQRGSGTPWSLNARVLLESPNPVGILTPSPSNDDNSRSSIAGGEKEDPLELRRAKTTIVSSQTMVDFTDQNTSAESKVVSRPRTQSDGGERPASPTKMMQHSPKHSPIKNALRSPRRESFDDSEAPANPSNPLVGSDSLILFEDETGKTIKVEPIKIVSSSTEAKDPSPTIAPVEISASSGFGTKPGSKENTPTEDKAPLTLAATENAQVSTKPQTPIKVEQDSVPTENKASLILSKDKSVGYTRYTKPIPDLKKIKQEGIFVYDPKDPRRTIYHEDTRNLFWWHLSKKETSPLSGPSPTTSTISRSTTVTSSPPSSGKSQPLSPESAPPKSPGKL